MGGITAEAGRFAFAEVVLPGVLVPDGDGGSWMIGIDPVRNQKQRGNAIARFDHVADHLDSETFAGQGINQASGL